MKVFCKYIHNTIDFIPRSALHINLGIIKEALKTIYTPTHYRPKGLMGWVCLCVCLCGLDVCHASTAALAKPYVQKK
jgi:hypothetical protein